MLKAYIPRFIYSNETLNAMKDKTVGKWKTLKSEYLIRRPWLTARKDCVELPSGVVLDEYYVLEYPAWVNVIARTKDGSYVVIRQYRHALDDVFWEIVAGVVDASDESPLAAAKRELWEETGYGGGEWRLVAKIAPNPGAMNNLCYCFVAEGVEKVSDQHLETTEDIAVHLMSGEEVRREMASGGFMQALMLAPLYKYMYEMNALPQRK